MSFKFNPTTGELDLVGSATDTGDLFPNIPNDKIVDVTYLDVGQRTQRISTVVISSILNPSVFMLKTIFWLDVGSMKQRIDKIQYSGTALGSDIIEKTFSYVIVNNKARVTKFTYTLV